MSGLLAKLRKSSASVAPPIERRAEEERRTSTLESDEQPLKETSKGYWERRIPVIACGAGLFSDGYLNSAVGPVNTILKSLYGSAYTSGNAGSNISALAFAGEVLGILFFGYTSDHFSRKWSLFISTIILFVFAALSAGAFGANGSLQGTFAALAAYRLLLGIGIGGEYPAGSVGCAESTGELESGKRNRWFIWFTNLQIDLGTVVAYIVATIVAYACTDAHLRAAWRIILGLGVVPPLSLIWMRFKLQEPEAFQREKMGKNRTPWLLVLKMYGFRMFVVSAIWFIYDFSSFAFSIYSTEIIDNIIPSTAATWKSFAWGILVNAFYLPGAIAGSWISDKWGPRTTLAVGVILQAITGYIMAGVYGPLSRPGNVAAWCVVYGFFLSFGELGPGDNIGLVAAKTCPTSIRGQYYAVASAMGKVGAFVGTYVFPVIQNDGKTKTQQGQYPFWVASSLALVSAALVIFCLPAISQDTIDEEDRRFRKALVEHGYDTALLGDGRRASVIEQGDREKGNSSGSEYEEKPSKLG
ncbi:MAG: hypothetical protein Q9162_004067 [Coniocarpon cinnabarinum]